MTENNKSKEYSFVLDSKGRKLAPCNTNKAWILIRKKKARLLQKHPMVIQLVYEVEDTKEITMVAHDGISAISPFTIIIHREEVEIYVYTNNYRRSNLDSLLVNRIICKIIN